MRKLITILIFTSTLSLACSFRIIAQIKPIVQQKGSDSLITPNSSLSQKDTAFFEIPDTKDFIEWDEQPQFPGGGIALANYIIKNTIYPQSAIKDSIEGRVIVIFTIDIDGSITDIRVLKGIRSDLDNECIRVVKGMPNFKPGRTIKESTKGWYWTNVKIQYFIPFNFSLFNRENKLGIIIKPR